MQTYENFIGIDVSKRTLDICVLQGNKVLWQCQIVNTTKQIAVFFKRLVKQNVVSSNTLICCEHTGLYTEPLTTWSAKHDYTLWLEKPMQLKKSMGMQRGKNDAIDAKRIALYAARFQDKCIPYQKPREPVSKLQCLLKARNRLLKVKKQMEVPLKEFSDMANFESYKAVRKCSLDTLHAILKNLKEVENQIQRTVQSDTNLVRLLGIITSVNGVGMITAVMLIVVTNEFKNKSSASQLACYAGIAPFPYQSGTSVHGKNKVSHLACKPLKTLLQMCALSAVRYSPSLKAYYERKAADGKNKMLVLNAIRNKIILRICACVRDNRKYEENYVKSFVKS